FVIEPDLLLMDEPFAALDTHTRADMHVELLRVWQAFKKTVVFVTHNVDEAVFLADRVVVLAGRPAPVRGRACRDPPPPRRRCHRSRASAPPLRRRRDRASRRDREVVGSRIGTSDVGGVT